MQRAELMSVIERLLDMAERHTTTLAPTVYVNEAAAYTDPARWTRERAHLFIAFPLVFGFAAELAAPGSYAARELAGVPVLVTRADDGVARAFLNVCRHRASSVAEGCGTAARFICPFQHLHRGLAAALDAAPTDE